MRTLNNNVKFIILLFLICILILVSIHYCKSNKKEHFTYGGADNVQELLKKRDYLSSKKIGPGLCVSSDSNNILNTFNYNKNNCEDICSNFSNCVGFTKSTNNSKNLCSISIDQQYSKNVSVNDQFADIKNDGISAVNQDCYRSTRVLNSDDLQPFPVGLANENRGNCLYYAPHCPALEKTNQKSVNGWYVDKTKEVDSYSKCNPGLLDIICNKKEAGEEGSSANSKPTKVIAAFAPKISPPPIPDNYKLIGENNTMGNCLNPKQIDKGYIGLNGCVQDCNSDQYCRSFTVGEKGRCNLVQDEPCNFNRSTNSSENNNTQWSFDKINLNINPPKTPNGYTLLPPNEKKTGHCQLNTEDVNNKKIFNNLGRLKGGFNECVDKCNLSSDCKNITINDNICHLVNKDCKFIERPPVTTYGTQWTFKKNIKPIPKKSYVKYPGMNAYTGAGANNLDDNNHAKLSLLECKSYCDSDPKCSCFVYRNSDNACWRRSNCNPKKFQKSASFDVYV